MSAASLGGCVDVNDVKHFLLRAGEGMKERGLGAQVLVTVRAFCGSPSRLAAEAAWRPSVDAVSSLCPAPLRADCPLLDLFLAF